MSVYATLGVMRVFLVGTPAGLVLEHVELKDFNSSSIEFVQVFMQSLEVHQAVRHIIIFNT